MPQPTKQQRRKIHLLTYFDHKFIVNSGYMVQFFTLFLLKKLWRITNKQNVSIFFIHFQNASLYHEWPIYLVNWMTLDSKLTQSTNYFLVVCIQEKEVKHTNYTSVFFPGNSNTIKFKYVWMPIDVLQGLHNWRLRSFRFS